MTRYNKIWNDLEKKKKPTNIRKIKTINNKKFYDLIDSNSPKINEIIEDLYHGDFYLIKKSISKKYLNNLKSKLINYSKKEKSSFYKMLDGCPNFWRRQDENIAKKYSFQSVRDSYYFFRWNKENFSVWKNFNKIWKYVKFLSGLKKNEWYSNKPRDIIIDRIQVVRYLKNTGHTEPHTHGVDNQRIILAIYMSKVKKDYSSGGTYFFKNKKKINVEKYIDVGDVGLFYGTLKHGVDKAKIDDKIKASNKLIEGRWWCGLYSPESNHKKNRHTSKPSK